VRPGCFGSGFCGGRSFACDGFGLFTEKAVLVTSCSSFDSPSYALDDDDSVESFRGGRNVNEAG
jgi:hypothetical protein